MGGSFSISLSPPMGSRIEDPTVKAELYTWSSEEFRCECALIYTSRSNPSFTCISHYSGNRDRVLFTVYDRLCEGNPVRVDMEFVSERDYDGYFVFRYAHAEESRGRFTMIRDEPGLFLLKYRDQFQQRKSQLGLYRISREAYEIQFNTGFVGDSVLTFFIRVLCHPFRGLVVDLSGPHCEYADYYGRQPIGLCYVDRVSGMPPRVKQSDLKAERQLNNVRAPLPSTQNDVALNTGEIKGIFNGSNIRGCHITVNASEELFKGFNKDEKGVAVSHGKQGGAPPNVSNEDAKGEVFSHGDHRGASPNISNKDEEGVVVSHGKQGGASPYFSDKDEDGAVVSHGKQGRAPIILANTLRNEGQIQGNYNGSFINFNRYF